MLRGVRLADEGDVEAIAAIYAPSVENTAISFELDPPDGNEILRRLQRTLETHPWLVCPGENGIAGYAYATPYRARAAYRWSCEVSVYVAGNAQRRGTGARLYRALIDVLIRQGFRRAYAGITLPNEASVGLHEALGFEPVGVYRGAGYKFDTWHDVGWWQRRLLVSDAPPEPIQKLATILSSVDLSEY